MSLSVQNICELSLPLLKVSFINLCHKGKELFFVDLYFHSRPPPVRDAVLVSNHDFIPVQIPEREIPASNINTVE